MKNQEVPFINQATGEVLGKAIVLPPDDKGRVYATIEISPEKAKVFEELTQNKHRNLTAGIVIEKNENQD